MKYCWSTDEEHFTGNVDSREAAIAELPDGEGWTGVCEEPDADHLAKIAADAAVEQMVCELADQCGEAAENFTPSTEQHKKLEALIAEWIRSVGVDCYAVVDIKKHGGES